MIISFFGVKSFATTHLNISRATFFAIHTARN
ncbi:hypothetical protein VD0004_g8743 [Verticillium dahliae]|nr:hypothetical protein VD0004_g8743 [Verticillium dahliae]